MKTGLYASTRSESGHPEPLDAAGHSAHRPSGPPAAGTPANESTGQGENAMKERTDPQLAWTFFLLMLSVILATVFQSSCGTSALSDEPIDDPTSLPAIFAVGKVVDESAGRTFATASAVFKGEGLTTVRLMGGSVELEDPQGNIHPMECSYNRLGAPYYTAPLPGSLELGAIYSFRVTLASGRMIVNSIKTPELDLQILSPGTGSTVAKRAPLELAWSGWNDRSALILIGPEQHTILDPFETGGKVAEDDGSTVLLPESMLALQPGPNLLSLARIGRTPANGFHPNSTVGAVLIATRPIYVD